MNSINEKYGLTKSYHHDLNGAGVCKKCHRPLKELKLKLCSVIGKEEITIRDEDEQNNAWK